ncbi:hypothetical protein ACG5V6_22955 [Streptomyces chitinivorans]|uniref:Uncharacterized protein n=1 Tax=Streptomyces chitinivorans TaxID=1257027 RepID=A0ABW7HYS0_9ACTN|nr:hypothetical protein [Streptomyces chitinivorans]MDH2411928.1 hypothetical protein [Streptomyces chitinivorans]
MPIIEYRGETANLRVLAREIEADPRLAGKCSLTLTPLRQDRRDSLRHAQWAEIAISVAAGLATNTLYDTLKALVERARDRGPVDEVNPRPESISEDTGGSEGVDR